MMPVQAGWSPAPRPRSLKLQLTAAAIVLAIAACIASAIPAADNTPVVSIITDSDPGSAAAHGMTKLLAVLRAKGVATERVETIQAARGQVLLVAGLAAGDGAAAGLLKSAGIRPPQGREALVIHRTEYNGKPAVLLAGSDDRGLMYAELDVADRVGWAADRSRPFGEVRDTSEAPDVPERALSIYTMNRAYFEGRFYDQRYWERYLDLLAQSRLNSLVLIFGYENGGFLAPPYPYFFDVDEFPNVRMVGITPDQQRKNLDALNRLIRMAHDRGINVTIGIWDHIYRGGVQANATPGSENALREPTSGLVWGVTAENLMPYTKAALTKFLQLVPDVDAIQFRMHDESGLKRGEQAAFWNDVFKMMKQQAPGLRFDARAKGLPDSTIEAGLAAGVNLRVTTKFWMEQMGLPFHPTQINRQNQFDRRHGYADMLRYPKRYDMHWRLWNGGTSRVLLWGDPEYVRRFVENTHLYDGDGFEVNEPLCTKMQAQAHDAKPFELLNPRYRHYDYEFERYWHFFQVLGRVGYHPATPAEVWEREFEKRFGKEAAPFIRKALHRASWILPRIVASCYPYSSFPMTRGWAEKQRLGDLAKYATAEGSDIAQFASFDEEAQNLLEDKETAKLRPAQNSRWFAQVSQEVLAAVAEAEKRVGQSRTAEFDVMVVDLRMLANLALYHSRRIPAAVAYRLYERTGDPAMLDQAIADERQAIDAWRQLVVAAGDVYAPDLMMGNRKTDLCGHWRDELAALENGLAELRRQKTNSRPGDRSRTRDPSKLLARAFADSGAPPEVRHEPITRAVASQPLTVTAQVRAADGVKWVQLRYRSVNQMLDYETLPMRATGRPDEYEAVVPAEHVSPHWDFMYYVEAMSNRSKGCIFPDLEKQTPYIIVRPER